MNFDQNDPPRKFSVGNAAEFDISDCGNIFLDENEQVTFVTDAGGEYDVVRKEWGFYATPSLNGRLIQFDLHPVLIRNTSTGRYFLLLVEEKKKESFNAYMVQEGLEVIAWLNSTDALDSLAKKA